MAKNRYMQIEGIKGDSTEAKHEGWIELEDFAWTVSCDVLAGMGGGRGHRTQVDRFTVVKRIDRSSASLYLACVNNQPIKKVVIQLCRPMGQENVTYMTYELRKAWVQQVRPGTAGRPLADMDDGAIPLEEVSFGYHEIAWEYTPTEAPRGGRKEGSLQGQYSLESHA